jgi:uncharacterized protein (DUF302 family)
MTIRAAVFVLWLVAISGPVVAGPAGQENQEPAIELTDVKQTVLKMSLKPGIDLQDAIDAMLSRAAELNMKMVGHLPVSEELQARGVASRHLEIYQFCNPEDAAKMVAFNPIYAAYMPCRVSIVEDRDGRIWLLTLNLDMLISSTHLPENLRKIAITINAQMIDIMIAGATGEF